MQPQYKPNVSTVQPRLLVPITDLPSVKCQCGGEVFSEGLMLRKSSPLTNTSGMDMKVPIPTFYCVSCGSVVDELLPEELKKPKVTL